MSGRDEKPKDQRSIRLHILVVLTLWAIIAALICTFQLCQNDAYRFTGIYGASMHSWASYDSELYLDMLDQSKEGAYLFENRFSPEQGKHPRYLNSLWVILGKAAVPLHLSPLSIYTLFRFAAVVPFIFALRKFLTETLKRTSARNLALLLIVFCGGMSWVFGIIGHWVMQASYWFQNARTPETNCFLSLILSPHITLAAAIAIWILAGYLDAGRKARKAYFLIPAMTFLLSTFHPYDVVVVLTVGVFYIVLCRMRDGVFDRTLLWVYMASILVSLPAIVYHKWALDTDPGLQGLKLQNALPPQSSLVNMSAILPLALFAFSQLVFHLTNIRNAKRGQILTAAWALALPVMVYSYPDVPFAWKLGVATPVPVFTLAAERIDKLLKQERAITRQMKANIAIAIGISAFGSLLILAAMVHAAVQRSEPYYMRKCDADAVRWLSYQPGKEYTVLSTRTPGVFVPRMAHKRAYAGHRIQSVDFWGKDAFAKSLFTDGGLNDRKLRQLHNYRVKWIYHGSEEKRLWWKTVPPSNHLKLVYQNREVKIFQVLYNASPKPDRL